MPTPEQVRSAVMTYVETFQKNDKQGWVQNFAEDAVHHDPANSPANVGREAIARFWDTSRQLAERIWRKVKGDGEPLRLVHDEPFEHDVQRRIPATEKAKRILGFEAATSLDEMLDEVIPWIAGAIRAGTI